MDASESRQMPLSAISTNNNAIDPSVPSSATRILPPSKLMPPSAVKRNAPVIEAEMKRPKMAEISALNENKVPIRKNVPAGLQRTKSMNSLTKYSKTNFDLTSYTSQASRPVKNATMKSATSMASIPNSSKMELTRSTSNVVMPPPVAKPKARPKRLPHDLKGRIEDLEQSLGSQNKNNTELVVKLQSQDERIAVLEMMNTHLNQTVATKETANQAVSQQLEELKRINREKDATLQDAAAKLNNKIIELEDQKSTMLRETQRLKSDLEASYAEISGLKIAAAQLTSSQAGVTLELSASKAEIERLRNTIQEYQDMNAALLQIKSEHETKIEEMNSKIRLDEQIRRKMHNTIQELKGNIRVFCRVRPTLSDANQDISAMKFTDPEEKSIEVTESSNSRKPQNYQFSFDRVFAPKSSQEDVFGEISQLVQSALDGYNVCIFAYGQTGSGKTYTMEGPPGASPSDMNNVGMIARAVAQIFSSARELGTKGWTYTMEAAFMEIYNETLRNLLDDDNDKKYEIRQLNNHSSEIYVTNLVPIIVKAEKEVHSLMMKAQKNRSIAATKCNERSSRSHYIFQLKLTGKNNITGTACQGTLHLVDLAGSERVKDSGSEGERLCEAKNINKSLSNLGNVIMALSQNDNHIPYRNSKLTHLLMNSLGGNSKTLMFVNVSPQLDHVNETLNSLRFAAKVNQCNIGTVRRKVAPVKE